MNGDLTDCPITEPVPAPEILVDGYQSTTVGNGVVKFTFFSLAHNPETNQQERRIVLRLSAALPVVMGIHQALGNLMADLERQAREVGDGGG